MSDGYSAEDTIKELSVDEVKDIVYDVRTFYYTEKYDRFCFCLNGFVAGWIAVITKFNPILFVLGFIVFDFLTIFIDDFILRAELKKSINKIKGYENFKRVIDKYEYTWTWNNEKDDLFCYWYDGLKKEFTKLEKKEQARIEAERKKTEVPKVVHKDELSITDAMNVFRADFTKLTSNTDADVFRPCINACDFIDGKKREGMTFRGTFAKQFVVYLDEIGRDMSAWCGFTQQQKDDHKEDTLLACETFERWVKKGVEAIEKDVASSLRVSVRTLVDMMQEDIDEVQLSIDTKETLDKQKEGRKEDENED